MFRNFRSALVVAVTAAALLPAVAADDQPVPLKFAWPVPSKATVTERSWKRFQTATTRYTVSVDRADTGDDLRVHLGDLTFVEFAGKPPTDPAIAAQIEEAQAVAKTIPDLLVGPDGVVKDVIDIEAVIEAQIARMEKKADERQKAMLPELRARMKAPEQVAALKRKSMDFWQAWVGEWIGLAIPEGPGIKARRPVRDVDGAERDAPAVYRRTPSTDGDGLVQIAREAVLDGDATKSSLDAWIAAASRQTGKAPPEGMFTGMVLASRAAVTIDPATLRPKRALREESCVVHQKDRDDLVVGVERHEYEFVWDAQPPKPPASDK